MAGLLDLPVELQLMVFKHLVPQTTMACGADKQTYAVGEDEIRLLAYLARSCRRLTTAATECLYQSISLTRVSHVAALLSTLLARRDLVQHVRSLTCTVMDNVPDENPVTWKLFIKTVQQSLTATTGGGDWAFTIAPAMMYAYMMFPKHVFLNVQGAQRSYLGDALRVILLMTHGIKFVGLVRLKNPRDRVVSIAMEYTWAREPYMR